MKPLHLMTRQEAEEFVFSLFPHLKDLKPTHQYKTKDERESERVNHLADLDSRDAIEHQKQFARYNQF